MDKQKHTTIIIRKQQKPKNKACSDTKTKSSAQHYNMDGVAWTFVWCSWRRLKPLSIILGGWGWVPSWIRLLRAFQIDQIVTAHIFIFSFERVLGNSLQITWKSSVETKHFWNFLPDKDHTQLARGHSHKMRVVVSTSPPHLAHTGSKTTFLLLRFVLLEVLRYMPTTPSMEC